MERFRKVASIAGLLALIVIIMVVLTTPAGAQEPTAELSFTKDAGDSPLGGQVSFTLAVANTGGAASSSQTIQDDLPADFEWFLGGGNIDCSLDTEDGVQVLHCDSFIVPPAYFDGTIPVAGVSYVHVIGEANECGSWRNTALLRDDSTGEVTPSNVAVLDVECPATPTPAPPTATPSPVAPTATPTTEPGNAPVPTATKTPITFIPKPPNTGNSLVSDTSEGAGLALGVGIVVILVLGFGLLLLGSTGRRR